MTTHEANQMSQAEWDERKSGPSFQEPEGSEAYAQQVGDFIDDPEHREAYLKWLGGNVSEVAVASEAVVIEEEAVETDSTSSPAV